MVNQSLLCETTCEKIKKGLGGQQPASLPLSAGCSSHQDILHFSTAETP